jgi:nucleotide-binding universal stress UspA family protein
MYPFRKILHPTDFSDQAAAAFGVACALARQHGAEVLVLHVMAPPIAWGEVVAREPPNGYEEQLWTEYLLPMRSPEPGVRVQHRLEEGMAQELIPLVAEETGCDLIVMGTHGRSGLRRLLAGSVAEHVLRTAPCPVLTIRGPLPGFVPSEGRARPATREQEAGPAPAQAAAM